MRFFGKKKTQKWQRKPKISRFLTFLSSFCQIFDRIRGMLKTINMVQGLLSSRRFRKDNGCFITEKSLKLTPKMTKVPKFSIFQSFYAFLVKFWRLRGLECFKGSTRKTLVVQWPFLRVYCIFLNENVSNWHRNWQKKHKIFQLSK